MYKTVTIPYVSGIRIHLKVTNSPDFLWQRNCLALKKLDLKISHNFSYTIILIKLLLSTHVTKTCSVKKTTNKVEA